MKIQFTGSKNFGQYLKVMIAGNPGAGKTLMSATFPNPFFASVEGGLLSVKAKGYNVPVGEIQSSDDIEQLLNILRQDPDVREKLIGVPVETVVLDTIDEIQTVLVQERLKKEKKNNLLIQDYAWLGEQMRGICMAFRNLDMHVVFTCHLKESSDTDTGRVWNKPALSGQTADKLPGWVDIAGVIQAGPVTEIVDGEAQRVIRRQFRTFPDRQYEWLKDRSGRLPMEIPVNFDDDFERIFKLVFGDVTLVDDVPEVEPVEVDLDERLANVVPELEVSQDSLLEPSEETETRNESSVPSQVEEQQVATPVRRVVRRQAS